jgi:hypothetical protein
MEFIALGGITLLGVTSGIGVLEILWQYVIPKEHQMVMRKKHAIETECCVCCNASANVVFVPCGHKKCCLDCAAQVPRCPICRERKQSVVRVYE